MQPHRKSMDPPASGTWRPRWSDKFTEHRGRGCCPGPGVKEFNSRGEAKIGVPEHAVVQLGSPSTVHERQVLELASGPAACPVSRPSRRIVGLAAKASPSRDLHIHVRGRQNQN